jgi:DNA-binding NarL/FixJ family response regulator
MIRVVVGADIRLYREGLREGLAALPDIEVVAAEGTPGAVLAATDRLRPDVVVVDLGMIGGTALLSELGGREVKLVALTVPEAEEAMLACAEAGVVGYVGRDGTLLQVVGAVRDASRDEVSCERQLVAALVRAVRARARVAAPQVLSANIALKPLTVRELEVARLIAFEGLSNKQIAQRLCIELPTVKNHVHNLLAKLGVNGRSQAAARLRELEPVRTN